MKTYSVILPLLLVMVLLASCYSGRPLDNRLSDNNNTYNVQYLFEHEGCKVYRFWDKGNYVYFTNCADNTIAISSDSARNYVQTIGSGNLGKTR